MCLSPYTHTRATNNDSNSPHVNVITSVWKAKKQPSNISPKHEMSWLINELYVIFR